MEIRRTRIEVNNVHIGVIQHGEEQAASTLVFLHGFTGCAANWIPLFNQLAAPGIRLIALDMLGHGESDAPGDPLRYSMEHCEADILAVLSKLGVTRGMATLLGYSMGGAHCTLLRFLGLLLRSDSGKRLAWGC